MEALEINVIVKSVTKGVRDEKRFKCLAFLYRRR